ncbi:hypothetical protein MSG28_000410 [Choristoneura fumiferana]|uniref:Uncharacterized protein n=1 Tax=Choristoneura fumiferana TaxID=7141 RepID=A0ACC0K0N0_CHOFU|nr:hypothetical protein MSG28_000410 [Choristoneura fumiferana]
MKKMLFIFLILKRDNHEVEALKQHQGLAHNYPDTSYQYINQIAPKYKSLNMEKPVEEQEHNSVVDDSSKRELQEAKARIEQLEKKIAILEGRIPQKYPEVKYLGYKERKRILADEIYHLASPASPPHYMQNPVKTIKTNTLGTINMLGPRACYDEGKRVAETLAYAYAKQENVSVRVARIFNTYGPRMHVSDGHLVNGLLSLMSSSYTLPVNIGNPVEHTIEEFAMIIKNIVPGCRSTVATGAAVEDDPQRRRPDITVAETHLHWSPKVSLEEGLQRTIDYFREELSRTTFYNNQTYMDTKIKGPH